MIAGFYASTQPPRSGLCRQGLGGCRGSASKRVPQAEPGNQGWFANSIRYRSTHPIFLATAYIQWVAADHPLTTRQNYQGAELADETPPECSLSKLGWYSLTNNS